MNKGRTVAVIGLILAGAVVLWLVAAYCLPVLLPFAIGLAAAQLAEPLTKRLCAARMPRWLAAAASLVGVFALLCGGLWLLLRVVFSELAIFVRRLPLLLQGLSDPVAQVEQWLLALAGYAPAALQRSLQLWINSLFESGSVLAERLYERLFALVSGMITGIPDAALFFLTSVLSSFMISARLPQLRSWLRRQVSAGWRQHAQAFWIQLRRILGGWCKAQLKLMGITFGIVTAGLFALGTAHPLLFGGLTALVDALPVFGAGVVLIPWSVLFFARGEIGRGIGMMLLYGIAALTRTALEPRLLGSQLGLHPLLTLLAIYAGFRLAGVGGMILFPLGAIMLKQTYDLISAARRKAAAPSEPD